ncbi:hypothetical protein Tco_0529156 [Tanacetum coccineum]
MDLETAQITTTAKLPTLKQENGNSFKHAAKTTTNADGTSTTLIPGPVTTEEKVQKKNDMKARSMLLMALPNEHLMTFNQYKDAKTLFAAIQTRFGGNEATKKTQKTLLKQMYENFSAPSTESLDSIFNRLQKIVSQLAILGENISQEDFNLNFLRSLPSEWNTHVVVWRNKSDLDTMSFDDLYHNFKIVEQDVKGTASSCSSSQNMAFVSSTSSTNKVNTTYGVSMANTQVSPASTQVRTASTQVSTANLSDDTVYAFLASQPNGSQLVYEDLEQIHEDDTEEMDLKWQLALLSMRTRRRNQDNKNRNQDSSRRTVNIEEISSKAMLAIDGAGFDWSYMTDDEVPTNMALMAFSDFEQLAVLKRDISYKDSEISVLKSELEKLKQEKEINQLKIEKLDNASKSLDKLIGSQILDKSRKGLGFISYNVVPPPPTGLFSPPNLDFFYSSLEEFQQLSNSGLEEFQQPKFEGYGPKTSKNVSEDTSNVVRESPDAPMIEKLVLVDKLTAITIKGKGWPKAVNTARPNSAVINAVRANQGHPQKVDQGYVDSGCSRHMTGNISYLSHFKEFDGGYVTFGGGAKGGKITDVQTATASTLNNGEMEITATIDGKVKIVTETSIRRHIKLEDSDGISNLPTTEIFEQLALMGNMRRDSKGYTEPIFPPHTNVADKAASIGVDVRYGGAATTVTGLEAGQGSGNIDKTRTMPYDSSLLRVHTLGSNEGRMQHNELIDLVTKLLDRVVALETDLMQTKKVYGDSFTKLIKKVKRLQKKDKLTKSRRKLRQIGVSTASIDFTTANVSVTTAGAEISTASPKVKTASDFIDDIAAESLVYITRSATKTKHKGKGIMEESESAMTKTKRQQEQERLGLETAVRLQEEFDEEERQRIARVHKAARSFFEVEWEDIRARVEPSEELVQRLQTKEREKYSKDDQAKMLQLKRLSFDEIKDLFETTMRRANTFVPMETEIRRGVPELVADSSQAAVTESTEAGGTKRAAEEELGQQSSKKQKSDELSQEELQQLMIIVPEEGMNIEALQTKYPIIDWEVYTEDSRMYWKIIRVGNHTEVYQVFEDMLKTFDRDDLVKLWSLVQERFNSTEPTEDKEIEIWVELKRLFEPDADDEL